jgi:methyltransferase family protein
MIKSYQEIQGWFDSQDVFEIALARTHGKANFLEIGTWLGCSTGCLAGRIKELNKDIKLYVVDTFKGDPTCQFHVDEVAKHGGSIRPQFIQNMTDLGVMDIIEIVEDTSWGAFDKLKHLEFDFIFHDGSHQPEILDKDLINYWTLLKNGGMYGGHDYGGDVFTSVNSFVNKNKLNVQNKSQTWYINK